MKWTGGKRRLVASIAPFIPPAYRTYREPFFGGGALFFALQPQRAVISDGQADLIEMYAQAKTRPAAVIRQLDLLKNNEETFYKVRESIPSAAAARAARLIYLCNLSFNGIHRVNRKGEFNVPYGHKPHMVVCDPAKMRRVSRALSHAELRCADFEEALVDAKPDDLVYLDPPYTVAHANNGFVKYNARIFSWEDQKRLARSAENLRRKGCHVIVSNADHSSIRALYPNFAEHLVKRQSIMAASADFRKLITESIFYTGAARKC